MRIARFARVQCIACAKVREAPFLLGRQLIQVVTGERDCEQESVKRSRPMWLRPGRLAYRHRAGDNFDLGLGGFTDALIIIKVQPA